MTQVETLFGDYATQLRAVVDENQDAWNTSWHGARFSNGIKGMSLNFTSILGKAKVYSAADITAHGSSKPIHELASPDKIIGEMASMKKIFNLTELQLRDLLTLKELAVSNERALVRLNELMFDTVRQAGLAPLMRLDWMIFTALSNKGVLALNTTNNPQGIITNSNIDFLMPAYNKINAVAAWSDTTNAKPIDDLYGLVRKASASGINFIGGETWMSSVAFNEMIATDQVKANVNTRFGVSSGQELAVTLDAVNAVLLSLGIPPIVIRGEVVAIEGKDGSVTNTLPWSDDNVTVVPSGELGAIEMAYAVEEKTEVPNVMYMDFNDVLISKFSTTNPVTESTGCELNAFPSIERINEIFTLAI